MNIYNEIVGITKDYLGPASERFVSRQIDFHLKKKPEELTLEDVPKIAEWIKASMAMLTKDPKVVEEASSRIAKLAN